MLNQFFYTHSNIEVLLLVCGGLIAISLVVLYAVHRLVDWEKREKDTSAIGLSYAIAGAVYAVALAFVAVGVYDAMDKAESVTTQEANSLSSLMFDSTALPAAAATELRADVSKYIEIVTKTEWPAQQAYHMEDENFAAGWAQVQKISLELSTYQPKTNGQATNKGELLQDVSDLYAARRTRLLAANSHLPDAVWQMMICGLALIVIYVCLFGPHNYKIHMAVTALTVFSVAVVFTLIIALDYPFRGDLSVDDDAFVGVQATADRLFSHGGK